MPNLILLLLCFAFGYILKRSERFPAGSFRVLNGFIIHISLPALILTHIHSLEFSTDLLFAIAMPWIIFVFASVLFWGLFLAGRISREVAAVLILTAGFGNTSFVGIPLIEAYFGAEYIGIGIIADQLGTFLCLGTVGIVFAIYAQEGVFRWKSMGKMVFLFPPSQALILAFFLRFWEYPEWLDLVLLRLGDTLTPLALFSVGLQLSLKEVKGNIFPLGIALSYKLILAPFIIFFLYRVIFQLEGRAVDVIIFEAGMAPMVTSSIIAIEKNLKPDLVALILGIGIFFSFISSGILYLAMAGRFL